MIYTTDTIGGFHRQVRKVTKTKGEFTSEMALLRLVYLAHKNIKKKWTIPLANLRTTAQKLAIWCPRVANSATDAVFFTPNGSTDDDYYINNAADNKKGFNDRCFKPLNE